MNGAIKEGRKETDHLVYESRVSFFSPPALPPAGDPDPFDSIVLASLFGRDLFRLRSTCKFFVKDYS